MGMTALAMARTLPAVAMRVRALTGSRRASFRLSSWPLGRESLGTAMAPKENS